MSRNLFDGVAEALVKRLVKPEVFIKAVFPSETKRVWSGLGEITFAGEVWQGVGEIQGLDVFQESIDSAAQGISVTFDALDDDGMLGLILGDEYQGSQATIYLSFWNTATGALIGGPTGEETGPPDLADGDLVSHHILEDITGDAAVGNDMTVFGTPTVVTGPLGGDAAHFDNNIDYMWNSTDALPLSAFPMTMSCWFKANGSTYDPLMFFANKADTSEWVGLYVNNVGGTLRMSIRGGSFNEEYTETDYQDDIWHFAMMTIVDKNDFRLYLDGTYRAAMDPNEVWGTSWDRFAIAAFADSSPIFADEVSIKHGKIHEVAFTSAEAKTYYYAMQGISEIFPGENGLRIHIPMNQLTAEDISGYRHDFELIGPDTIAVTGPVSENGRTFGTSSYHRLGQVPEGTIFPFSMSCWFKTSVSGNYNVLFSMAKSTSANDWLACEITSSKVRINARSTGGGITVATGTTSVNDDTWRLAMVVFRSSTDKELYIDGVSEANLTANYPLDTAFHRIGIAALVDSTPIINDGISLADFKYHSVAFSDAEAATFYTDSLAGTLPPSEGGGGGGGGEIDYSPLILWEGRLDTDKINHHPEKSKIELFAEHKLVDQLRPREVRWTYQDQARLYPGQTDTGLDRIERMQDNPVPWGRSS